MKKHLQTNFWLAVFVMALVSCKKNDQQPDDTERELPQVSTFSYYFIATIDGQEIRYEAKLGMGEYRAGPSSSDYNVDGFTDAYEGSIWEKNDDHPGKDNFYIYLLEGRSNPDYPGFNYTMNMLQKKTYPFGVGKRNAETVNGVVIQYKDSNGVLWQTETGAQTGSKFEVVELVETATAKTFRAHFNCKLYSGSQSKVVTNGTARGWYSPQRD